MYDNVTHAFGYVGLNTGEGYVVTSFRGSSNLPNWLADFDFVQVPYPGFPHARVHQGFYACWKGLESQVRALVARAQQRCPTCALAFTGHSLGAAIAGVAALETATVTPTPVHMYTYGMPRIGDQPLARAVDTHVAHTMRMVHAHDAVPHLPPREVLYYHVATEVWNHRLSNGSTVYSVCDHTGEDPACSDSVPPSAWSIADHLHYMGQTPSCAGRNPP